MKLIIYGKPQAQQRPRMAVGKNGTPFCYDKQSASKTVDRFHISNQMHEFGVLRPYTCPIAVHLIFHMGMARKRKEGALKGDSKPTKPDIDNLAKYYLDVMTDLVYEDDRLVTTLHCEKIFSDKAKVEIFITPLESTTESRKEANG